MIELAELADDPHPLLRRLRETEPVAWVPALGGWLVTRYDVAVSVLRDAATFTVDDPRFSTARVVGPSMLSLDGAAHARHREPFVPPFKPAQVRDRFAGFVATQADRLIAAVRPQGTAELRAQFAGPLAVAVVAEALGLAGVTADTVLSWYAAIVDAVSEVTAGRTIPPGGTAAVEELRVSVNQTLGSGDPDSLLVRAATGLRPPEVVSNAAVLMFGGIDTTEGMIANAALHLLERPALLALVKDQEALLPNVIEESVRFEPAAAVVDRYATKDIELGGAPIRRGDLVIVSIAGANRDPDVFPDPDTFDPERANARVNLAFAQGPHFCVGAQLARTETAIALHRLLDLPELRLDRPTSPHGLVFRKPPSLHVRWAA